MNVTDTAPAAFTMIDNGRPVTCYPVTCYPVTFDGRKLTVHTADGPRTRTRRNRGGYATAATLRGMGYRDICANVGNTATDEITYYTTARD